MACASVVVQHICEASVHLVGLARRCDVTAPSVSLGCDLLLLGRDEMLCSWHQTAAILEAREIPKEDYDRWRYHYPEFDKAKCCAKVLSQELSDMLIETFFDERRENP